MPYRLTDKESVQNGIRRVISEQIERALAELSDEQLDRCLVIHQVRKRCKKIRGALRLVRDGRLKTPAFAMSQAGSPNCGMPTS